MLNLNRIDLATEEDKSYQIDHWAFLFKSTTWEEMSRLQCEARVDYYRTQLGLKYEMEKRDAEIENLSAEMSQRDDMIESLSSEKDKLLTWALEHGYQSE